MSEKVVITKEQAEALERLLKNGWTKKQIFVCHFHDPIGWGSICDDEKRPYNCLNNMDFEELVMALCVGYEAEVSPEEIILKRYKDSIEIANNSADKFRNYYQGQADAIEMVLRTLKIEIEGIHK